MKLSLCKNRISRPENRISKLENRISKPENRISKPENRISNRKLGIPKPGNEDFLPKKSSQHSDIDYL